MILRRRMISDLSPGSTPRQTNGCLSMEAFGTVAPMEDFPHALGRDQPRDDRHMDLCPPLEDADRARYLPVLQAVDVHEAPFRRAQTTRRRHGCSFHYLYHRPRLSSLWVLHGIISMCHGVAWCSSRQVRHLI